MTQSKNWFIMEQKGGRVNLAIFLLSMPAIIVAAEDTVLPLFERFRTFYITRVRYMIAENQDYSAAAF